MDSVRTTRLRVRTVLALAGLMCTVACTCPPLVESYETPRDTLALWQARLCRDDAQGEYSCLAASLQRAMSGFRTYHSARAAMLEQDPVAAWALQRADLDDAIVDSGVGTDGQHAWIVLGRGDDRLTVRFEREPYVTVRWSDGSSRSARQKLALDRFLDRRDGTTWLGIVDPPIPAERLAELRAIVIEPRWKISDLAGLATRSHDSSPQVIP